MRKNYEVVCNLDPDAASKRIQELLLQEGVEFTTAELRIISTRTPVVFLSIQPTLYTRKNWVGFNPFVFVSGIEISFKPMDDDRTKVSILIDQRRSVLLVALWAIGGLLAARAMPEPAGAFFLATILVGSWFGIVQFLGGHLLRSEILDALTK